MNAARHLWSIFRSWKHQEKARLFSHLFSSLNFWKIFRLLNFLKNLCISYLQQRYYLFKKEIALIDETKPYDPLDVEFIFTESIMALRPDFKFTKTYSLAVEAGN